jgi:hypothetical protein
MALVKYLMLLPITYNDRTRVPKALLEEILDQVFVFAGGYTIAGAAKGAYRMKSGAKQIDHSLQVWIAIDQVKETELRDLVAGFCKRLDQETMYLERAGGEVEFIPPAESEGEHDDQDEATDAS